MIKKVMNFFKEEEGAGLAEYALLLVLIAVVCSVSLTALGVVISAVFSQISAALV